MYGENTAKILLQQEVDAVAGGLVWNPTENIKVGGNSYQVKLESYSRWSSAQPRLLLIT